MSFPTEFDFILIKKGDGATPTELFTLICGIQNVNVNHTAQSSDRFVRDCAKPGKPAKRKPRVTGDQLDVTGNGLSNADMVATLMAAVGRRSNYKLEGYQEDGTDGGKLLGTYEGAFVMTTNNIAASQGSDSSAEIALASDGEWTWTPAP